jgi:hypothetical protein
VAHHLRAASPSPSPSSYLRGDHTVSGWRWMVDRRDELTGKVLVFQEGKRWVTGTRSGLIPIEGAIVGWMLNLIVHSHPHFLFISLISIPENALRVKMWRKPRQP